MNYKLAKQLKDAGYPQKAGLVWYYLEKKHCKNNQTGDWYTREAEWKLFHHRNPKALNIEWYYCPSLEELIEATTDFPNQFSLYGRDKNRWEATLVGFKTFGAYLPENIHMIGSTPEEAVANLWLELNKKQNP